MIAATAAGRLVRPFAQASPSAPYRSTIAIDGAMRGPDGVETKFLDVEIWPAANDRSASPAYDSLMRLTAAGKEPGPGSPLILSGDLVFERSVVQTDDGEPKTYYRESLRAYSLSFAPVASSARVERESEEPIASDMPFADAV